MKCKLVDMFSSQKFNGNSLIIFYDCDNLSSKKMLSLTKEMRQFESIFLFCKMTISQQDYLHWKKSLILQGILCWALLITCMKSLEKKKNMIGK